MSNPLVSICIPTYNVATTVAETLQSILDQTYTNIVVHISDNASTDETLKVVESFKDPRIFIHRYTENIGGEGNFTRCIQLGEGKYTAIFHADDIYEPEIIEKQVLFLEKNPEVGSVFTEALMIDEAGHVLGSIGHVPQSEGVAFLSFIQLLKMMLLHHNFLVCPSVLVRTDIYREKIVSWGGALFRSASDVDMWLRLSKIAPIAVLNERLMRYRISTAQFSNKNRNRTERTDFFLVMEHYLARDDIQSLLTKDDLRYYGWLERHESVAVAMNLCLVGKEKDALKLLKGFICWDAFYAGLVNRRGLVTLAGGILLKVLLLLGISKETMSLVHAIKKISWR